jgi:predicted HD phosphohydrolase
MTARGATPRVTRHNGHVTAPASVDQLLALLARGAGVYDEPEVDGLAHALQCGATLRTSHPGDPELAVAGLVHDVADIAFPDDHADHASRGAGLVEPLLGARVAHLVDAHVDAKRYLVATDPSYRAQLSPRSVQTLQLQGDALDAPAVDALASDRDLAAILALRRADERAKDPHARPPALDTWRSLLEQVAR